jgi:hypothetical protein
MHHILRLEIYGGQEVSAIAAPMIWPVSSACFIQTESIIPIPNREIARMGTETNDTNLPLRHSTDKVERA